MYSAHFSESFLCIRALSKRPQQDPSLSLHHSGVTQAVMNIFKILGLKSVPFLESILPTMLVVVRYMHARISPQGGGGRLRLLGRGVVTFGGGG